MFYSGNHASCRMRGAVGFEIGQIGNSAAFSPI